MSQILIVEDDADISAVIDFNLSKAGFETLVSDSGARAMRLISEARPDLIILDLMLPDIPGLDICRQVRQDEELRHTPILMLTAKGEESDRLAGLAEGADDYLVKPFSVRELILRVQAVLRRAQPVDPSPALQVQDGPIVIDEDAHRVYVAGEETTLTHTEYRLLVLFLRRPERVFSRRQLLDQVWNMPGNIVTRTVDTHVKRLREKLGEAGDCIETVRGVGYRFVRLPPAPSERA